MDDQTVKKALWRLQHSTVVVTLEESSLGGVVVNKLFYSAQTGQRTGGDPTWYMKGKAGEGTGRYERLVAEMVEKHGEPTERQEAMTLQERLHADKETVVGEAQKAGVDLSPADVLPDPETGVLTVDGMYWWEWLEGMTEG